MAPAESRNGQRTAWLAVPIAAALLALRKPWALHTPQFWAEDGSIFMQQDHDWGARAILEPYNGYLHLLPRLIAWLASRAADVAWWPAIYNGLSFAIAVALFARLASRRVELPCKAGLMLAFAVVVSTGEVLTNATNLQWVTAFFLVLQLFTARAETWPQRLGDLAILGVIGLNGPFAIVLLPLFAWRAWRERGLDSALALGVVALCAAVQARFVVGGSLSLDGTSAPFRPLMFFSIIGSRLVTWPILGPAAVKTWPLAVHAALGVAFIGAVAAYALRRDPRRPMRLMIVGAFALMTLACVARVRADTWRDDNLTNGDRYFYISRVLLAWLVILELNAVRRGVAWGARTICVAAVLTHAPHFTLRAPPDYKWAEHCDPIRRGTPANILTLPEGWWIEYPGRGETRR